jgi:hypothetical protein
LGGGHKSMGATQIGPRLVPREGSPPLTYLSTTFNL